MSWVSKLFSPGRCTLYLSSDRVSCIWEDGLSSTYDLKDSGDLLIDIKEGCRFLLQQGSCKNNKIYVCVGSSLVQSTYIPAPPYKFSWNYHQHCMRWAYECLEGVYPIKLRDFDVRVSYKSLCDKISVSLYKKGLLTLLKELEAECQFELHVVLPFWLFSSEKLKILSFEKEKKFLRIYVERNYLTIVCLVDNYPFDIISTRYGGNSWRSSLVNFLTRFQLISPAIISLQIENIFVSPSVIDHEVWIPRESTLVTSMVAKANIIRAGVFRYSGDSLSLSLLHPIYLPEDIHSWSQLIAASIVMMSSVFCLIGLAYYAFSYTDPFQSIPEQHRLMGIKTTLKSAESFVKVLSFPVVEIVRAVKPHEKSTIMLSNVSFRQSNGAVLISGDTEFISAIFFYVDDLRKQGVFSSVDVRAYRMQNNVNNSQLVSFDIEAMVAP